MASRTGVLLEAVAGVALAVYGAVAVTRTGGLSAWALVMAGIGLMAGAAVRRWAPERANLHLAATFVAIGGLLLVGLEVGG